MSIQILNNSTVSSCLGVNIGNLKEEISIKKIWNSKKNLKFQSLIKNKKILPGCFRCCGLDFNFENEK